MKNGHLFILMIIFSLACNQPRDQSKATSEQNAPEEDNSHFGKFIDESGALATDDFMSLMADQDTLEVKISAVAQEVCQAKGCWMKVEVANGQSMRIKFKDYGFFVPKDIAGKEIVFSGVAFKATTSVEELKHYAEDAGASEETIAAIEEPETSISFLADGVLLK